MPAAEIAGIVREGSGSRALPRQRRGTVARTRLLKAVVRYTIVADLV
jgi:hypothetical protein